MNWGASTLVNKTPRVCLLTPGAPSSVLNGAGHRGSSSHGEQRGRSELARRAARQARLAAPPAAPEAGARRRSHWLSLSGAAQAASLHSSTRLLPARATQLSAARPAMRRSGSVAPPTAPASGAGWPRHWLSQNGARGGLSRLASLLHSAAAGVGDSVTPWGVSCLRVGSVAILCPALCRVWRRSGGGTIATAGRTRGGSSRPAVLSAQSACIVKRSTMLALSTASGCYVLIF